jgi:hypothetical protein
MMEQFINVILTLLGAAVIALVTCVLRLNSRVVKLETVDTIDYRGLHQALQPIEQRLEAIAVKVGVVEDRRHEH